MVALLVRFYSANALRKNVKTIIISIIDAISFQENKTDAGTLLITGSCTDISISTAFSSTNTPWLLLSTRLMAQKWDL